MTEPGKHFTVSASDIDRCPILSMSPTHYRPDGTCKCTEPGPVIDAAEERA